MRIKRLLATVGASLAVALGMPMTAMAATTVVTPSNLQGWGFVQETPTGSGSFVTGPGIPPLGQGSANLIVDSTGGEALGKLGYRGLRLSDIDTLQYSTYRSVGTPALAIALQFNIDNDLTDANNAFQGRLVYEPYHTQTVATGTWQTWNTLNDSAGTGTGNWWGSPNANSTLDETCPQSNPCTWTEVLAAFPNAGIHNSASLGAVLLKAGGGWTGGFNGNVDALRINNDTYNFEGDPSNVSECRNGGFENFTDPSFDNQGQCVSFVRSNSNNNNSNTNVNNNTNINVQNNNRQRARSGDATARRNTTVGNVSSGNANNDNNTTNNINVNVPEF